MAPRGTRQPNGKLDLTPSSLSDSTAATPTNEPRGEAARKSGAERRWRESLPETLAAGLSAALQPRNKPRGVGSDFGPQQGSEVQTILSTARLSS